MNYWTKWKQSSQTNIKYFVKHGTGSLLLLGCLVFSSCIAPRDTLEKIVPSAGNLQGYVSTSIPFDQKMLDQARRSTYLINSITYFTQYFLPEDQSWTREMLENIRFDKQGWDKTVITRPASGTGTLISKNENIIAFLTCAHIFDHSDTLYVPLDKNEPEVLGTVLVKTRNDIYLPEIFIEGNLEIISIDTKADLCILKGITKTKNTSLHVFPFSIGNSEDLDWGNDVYVLGYPQGFQMVTKGMVSKPFKFRPYDFVIDAPFNKGMSGGPVLALNAKTNLLELVGIGKAVAAETKEILVPEKSVFSDSLPTGIKYSGKIYSDRINIINKGICFTISTKDILSFLEKHQKELDKLDLDVENFLNGKPSTGQDDS